MTWPPAVHQDVQDAVATLQTTVTDTQQSAINLAVNTIIVPVVYNGTAWPNRPSTTGTSQIVLWIGPGPGPASGGTTDGGSAKYAPGDLFFLS